MNPALFQAVQKIDEALAVYGLKRYLIIYLYAASWVVTIWLPAAIKVRQGQLPPIESCCYESFRSETVPEGIVP